ncbi:MAG: AAA family ATPase [Bacteroidia bacterium]|nr:AAA family ATPase [Bacteroidia bacterium]
MRVIRVDIFICVLTLQTDTNYAQTVYINLEKNKRFKTLFEDDFDIKRIIIALQTESGVVIQAENTLIIFDEIQEVPEALTALKYFNEDAPEYHIATAGSLLGVILHSHISFPVGKVEFMELYPMTFHEFLQAAGEMGLVEILRTKDWKLITTFKCRN